MKRSNPTTAALMGIALAAASSASFAGQQPAPPATTTRAPAAKPPGKTDTAVERIRSYSIAQREQAVADAKRAMEKIDARIVQLDADMRARGARMDAAARKRADAAMADLRTRRDKLEGWSTRMREAAGPAWEEVKSGFVASYRELADALHRARAQFDREPVPNEAASDQDEDASKP